jgi:hypothetical protein
MQGSVDIAIPTGTTDVTNKAPLLSTIDKLAGGGYDSNPTVTETLKVEPEQVPIPTTLYQRVPRPLGKLVRRPETTVEFDGGGVTFLKDFIGLITSAITCLATTVVNDKGAHVVSDYLSTYQLFNTTTTDLRNPGLKGNPYFDYTFPQADNRIWGLGYPVVQSVPTAGYRNSTITSYFVDMYAGETVGVSGPFGVGYVKPVTGSNGYGCTVNLTPDMTVFDDWEQYMFYYSPTDHIEAILACEDYVVTTKSGTPVARCPKQLHHCSTMEFSEYNPRIILAYNLATKKGTHVNKCLNGKLTRGQDKKSYVSRLLSYMTQVDEPEWVIETLTKHEMEPEQKSFGYKK